ncbi:MAG: hypothetical protein IJU14_01335 [Clostridia bacterium]|jgi:hypothetical protein|nr:hypothetical protein [Clostridia bacterium]
MKWINAELFCKVQTDTDKLNNPIYEDNKIADIKIRATSWNVLLQSALGQEYLSTHRKFLTNSTPSLFRTPYLCTIVAEGKTYTVEKVKNPGKFTVLTVKVMK